MRILVNLPFSCRASSSSICTFLRILKITFRWYADICVWRISVMMLWCVPMMCNKEGGDKHSTFDPLERPPDYAHQWYVHLLRFSLLPWRQHRHHMFSLFLNHSFVLCALREILSWTFVFFSPFLQWFFTLPSFQLSSGAREALFGVYQKDGQ